MVLTTTMMASHQQMTAREKDIYDTYSEDLERLTFNSKPVINSMTELANEYSSDFAHVIVRCIEDKIKIVPSTLKLPLLYLLDSILKNHTRPYHDLLQQNIVSVFAHVFHNVPRERAEKDRTLLYKLRLTWTDTYFSITKLNQLDKKVQTLDPQWPLIPSKKAVSVERNVKPSQPSIHINPAVFGRQPSLTPETDLEAQLKQKELELMELKMKKEELALETMRKQISIGQDMQANDDTQKQAVQPSLQSTSLQGRAKSPGPNSSGISSTSIINKLSTNKIIIDEKKLKDPRMRSKILEAINKAEGINTLSGKGRISLQSREHSSKSTTPEPNKTTDRNKSKSPLSQGHFAVHATSTTGYNNSTGNFGKTNSRTPSPVRERQSPTSTSSPRYADSAHLLTEKKGTTPPPPPRISDDIKSTKKEDRRISNKTTKRGRLDSAGKDKTRSLTDGSVDKGKKRKRDQNTQDRDNVENRKASSSGKKFSKYPTNSKSQKEDTSKTSRLSQDGNIERELSSSPSPPPTDRDHISRDDSKARDKTSSGINFKVKGRAKIKKEKNPFRIPKKEKMNQGDGRTPSPQSFTSEGPLVEFNEGRSPLKERKRQGAKSNSNNQLRTKKSKLSDQLFGDGANNSSQVSPNEGWATVKKEKPDLFRTPVLERRAGHGAMWGRGGLINDKSSATLGIEAFPSLFHRTLITGMNQQGDTEPQIENILQGLRNYDPELVLKEVIPDIVKQGQNLMKNKEITVEQFSVMMKRVFQLKEQVMMQQAEKRHNKQQMINPWQEGAIPGDNINNQQFNAIADRLNSLPSTITLPISGLENSTQFSTDEDHVPQSGMALPPPLFSMGPDKRNAVAGIGQISGNIGLANRDLPIASDAELTDALADPVKRIEIDEYPRDIRFYAESALIIMGPEAKDMRELRFKNEFGSSSHRRIIIDQKYIIPVEIASPGYKEFKLEDGITHTIKIGAPTRELWIDGQWHELYFNKSAKIQIGPTVHEVFLDGPAPNVDIGSVPRNDLCTGTVQLIIDGNINTIVTIFLDSKPQVVNIAGKQHILQFVQGLKLLLINGHPFRTEFGGMPMVVYVNQVKHYLRLTALPAGVNLNSVQLWNMGENQNVYRNPSPTPNPSTKGNASQLVAQADDPANVTDPSSPSATNLNPPSPSVLANDNSQEAFSVAAQSNAYFDRLINMIPTTPTNLGGGLQMPIHSPSESSLVGESSAPNCSYSSTPVQNKSKSNLKKDNGTNSPNDTDTQMKSDTSSEKPVDVHNLWTQLLGAGLVSNASNSASMTIPGLDSIATSSNKTENQSTNDEKENQNNNKAKTNKQKGKTQNENVKDDIKASKKINSPSYKEIVLKSHHSSIKTRQAGIIDMIYDPTALQCKNCGLRFSSSQSDSVAYSQHLDWHFRIKRREKDNAKKAESRRWYFEKVDWIISDEIEDEKDVNEDNKSRSGSPDEIPVVPASSNPEQNMCPICHEEFDQFYKQDFADMSSGEVVDTKGSVSKDDDGGGRWHLKNAIRPIVNENDDPNDATAEKYKNRAFHPQCYQDRNNATLNETSVSMDQSTNEQVSTTNLPEDIHETPVIKNECDNISDESAVVESMGAEEIILKPEDVKAEVLEHEITPSNIIDDELPDSCFENVTQKEEDAKTDGNKDGTEADSPNIVESAEAVQDSELATQTTVSMEVENVLVEKELIKDEDQPEIQEKEEDKPESLEATKAAYDGNTTNLHNKSLDGNTVMAIPTSSGLGSNLTGGIRINILPTQQSKGTHSELERQESTRSVSESDDGESEKGVEFDPDSIVQPSIPEHADLKPKLKGRKLVEMPMQRKGDELSSLCSIM